MMFVNHATLAYHYDDNFITISSTTEMFTSNGTVKQMTKLHTPKNYLTSN